LLLEDFRGDRNGFHIRWAEDFMGTIEFDIITAKNVLSSLDGAMKADITTTENLQKICAELDLVWQSDSERELQDLYADEITRWMGIIARIITFRNVLEVEIRKWEAVDSRLGP
jgi:hypothetical protein